MSLAPVAPPVIPTPAHPVTDVSAEDLTSIIDLGINAHAARNDSPVFTERFGPTTVVVRISEPGRITRQLQIDVKQIEVG